MRKIKLLFCILVATFLLSCKVTPTYSLFDPDIPSGYVYERRNGHFYVNGDSGNFMVKIPCKMWNTFHQFSYTYEVGELFCKDSIQSKIIEWGG